LEHTTEELQAAKDQRAETSDRLVDSNAERKLIVAGPGTGKTYNFRRALKAAGGKGLALTFIRALARELERDLGDLAQVNTFHGFCKQLAYQLSLDGLGKGLHYYPPLLMLIAEDLHLLGHGKISDRNLEHAFHNLDDGEGYISAALAYGEYYNAVSHADVVYRVLRHLEEKPEAVPEFPLVVVDEYQDFCLLETRFIDVLRDVSPVLVAGDDDQALYAFKDSSPEFIRALAEDEDFERFDLPYCSRCTEVIVDAVNSVVAEAQDRGNLADRIDREYLCYLPEKLKDSEAHPEIIWAECSVEKKNAPYMGMYVAEQIASIPEADIAESHKEKYPTVLVIGRRHLLKGVYDVIKESFANAVLRESVPLEIDVLDGYRRLATDPASRLGWRILIHARPPKQVKSVLEDALTKDKEPADLLDEDYKAHHLGVAERIRAMLDDGGLTSKQAKHLEAELGRPFEAIEAALGRDEEGEEQLEPEPEEGIPSIVCTSLLGAKGLSAGYVFIVGFNDGIFPEDSNAVADDEVCKLIVGLSRTRKQCHVVSFGFWGTGFQAPSSFLDWLDVPIEKRDIRKEYWSAKG
jgi:superfamily I DNA/RNA helicase